MRVRMTFRLTERHREALGRALGCKRPATRVQAVQWIACTLQDALYVVMKAAGDEDPRQQMLPFASATAGEDELAKKERKSDV